jgi:hypothetical protein
VIRGETWRRDVPGFEVRFGNAALVRLPLVEASACLFHDLGACGIRPPAEAARRPAPRPPRAASSASRAASFA